MNIRRILCLALMLITVLALAACTPDTPEEPTTYTVSFDTNGGSSVAAISVKDGEKAIAPTAPTKAGYEFAGWYAGDAAFDFDTAIKADTALTAKWTKLTYTITYKDGENVLNLAPATYDIESAFTLPGATKEHYNFMGWYVDANFETGKQKITTGEEGNITLYAQFTVKNYGITYHLYDGENSDANMYYIGFKAYAPVDAVSFKEDLKETIEDDTMYYFEGEFAGVDAQGRKYSIVWLPAANHADGTWTYYGSMSSESKYIGWYYTVEWYDVDGKVIAGDQIRINLSNEDCHNNIKPYYMTNYATSEEVEALRESISTVEESFQWGEL